MSTRHLLRWAAALTLALAGVGGVAHAGGGLTASCAAPSPHATLAVDEGNGTVRELCIGFNGAAIGGDELLRAAASLHPDIRGQGRGETVCQVDGVPTPEPSDCFGSSAYWALFTAAPGGSWQYSHVGIGAISIADGGAEGLRYNPQPPAAGNDAAPRAPTTVCPTSAPPPPPPPAAAPSNHAAARPPTPAGSTTTAASPNPSPAGGTPSPGGAVAGLASPDLPPSHPVVISEKGRPANSPAAQGPSVATLVAWALAAATVIALGALALVRLRRRPGALP